MIIPKDATPPARGEPDAFHTPKVSLETLLSELRELDGIGSPEPRTPFSPKRMNLRGAVRVPLPPSEIDRVGAELSEMRGGLSRRDVGVALVVAGLGALTLAFT